MTEGDALCAYCKSILKAGEFAVRIKKDRKVYHQICHSVIWEKKRQEEIKQQIEDVEREEKKRAG